MNDDKPTRGSLSMLVLVTLELELVASGYWCLYSCDNLSDGSGGWYFVKTGGGLYNGFLLVDFFTFLLKGAFSFMLKFGMSGNPCMSSGI